MDLNTVRVRWEIGGGSDEEEEEDEGPSPDAYGRGQPASGRGGGGAHAGARSTGRNRGEEAGPRSGATTGARGGGSSRRGGDGLGAFGSEFLAYPADDSLFSPARPVALERQFGAGGGGAAASRRPAAALIAPEGAYPSDRSGRRLVGRGVKVYMPEAKRYVSATVTDYRADTGAHQVEFLQSRKLEWVDFKKSNAKWNEPMSYVEMEVCKEVMKALRDTVEGGRKLSLVFEILPTPKELPVYYEEVARPVVRLRDTITSQPPVDLRACRVCAWLFCETEAARV